MTDNVEHDDIDDQKRFDDLIDGLLEDGPSPEMRDEEPASSPAPATTHVPAPATTHVPAPATTHVPAPDKMSLSSAPVSENPATDDAPEDGQYDIDHVYEDPAVASLTAEGSPEVVDHANGSVPHSHDGGSVEHLPANAYEQHVRSRASGGIGAVAMISSIQMRANAVASTQATRPLTPSERQRKESLLSQLERVRQTVEPAAPPPTRSRAIGHLHAASTVISDQPRRPKKITELDPSKAYQVLPRVEKKVSRTTIIGPSLPKPVKGPTGRLVRSIPA